MVKGVQFVVIEMSMSCNARNHVKTIVHDSGIILASSQSNVRNAKHEYEGMFDNVIRIGDTHYDTVDNGVLYRVHRYEYVARVPYHC